jgi:hypothetical protein
MNDHTLYAAKAAARLVAPALLVGTLGLISACASNGTQGVTGFDQLNLAPGVTGQCDSSPCRVFLQIPAGTGSYEVTANEVKVGDFPAGQNADLGSFWQSQAFEIKGLNVPKAYAYIPNQP